MLSEQDQIVGIQGLAHDLVNPGLQLEKPEASKKDHEFTYEGIEI